jgi:hypothetical protein
LNRDTVFRAGGEIHTRQGRLNQIQLVQAADSLDDIDSPVHMVHHRTVVPGDRAVAQQNVSRLYPPDHVAPFATDGQALRPVAALYLLGHEQV